MLVVYPCVAYTSIVLLSPIDYSSAHDITYKKSRIIVSRNCSSRQKGVVIEVTTRGVTCTFLVQLSFCTTILRTMLHTQSYYGGSFTFVYIQVLRHVYMYYKQQCVCRNAQNSAWCRMKLIVHYSFYHTVITRHGTFTKGSAQGV